MMMFAREIILKCFYRSGCARLELYTRKCGNNRETFMGELHSPVTINDGAGFIIKVHGDGRYAKCKKGYRKMQDQIDAEASKPVKDG